ncbi:MAG TPA: DNA polymerase III subunit beta [Ignavibacteriaceae bacterium]|nr:DNA polymerase III subunit beta [Ignavibacteriaceae bacterium]
MKFNINSKTLEKLLARVLPAIPTRTPLPVIENFLFEIEEGKLVVTATDLEIALTSSLSIDADENLRIVIPARLFYDIVKSLGDTQIHFEVDHNSKMKLKTDKGEYFIGYSDASEYPVIPVVDKGKSIEINGKILKKAIDQTLFAVSKEAMRQAMLGLLFELTPEGIKFVATDGHRLVKYQNKTFPFATEDKYVIPERAVTVLSKLIPEGDVKIYLSSTNIVVDIDDLELNARLISEKYPDYNSVIPIENENTLKVNTGELRSAVRRMLLFSTSNYQQVKLAITADNVEVSAEDIDRGSSAKENVNCEYIGEPMDIGFNTGYLNDVLSHFEEDEIVFKLHSPIKACILEPREQKENEDLMMLLMPVRLNT